MDEFKAVKKILDSLSANWDKLAPDTRLWLKSRFAALDDGKRVKSDVDKERV
jgi:hypothetical protein